MSDLLQPGLHPDADILNAFADEALPAHERAQTLAHLADCAHCREIVFLAQQAAPLAEHAPAPASAWQRWLNSVPLFGVGIGVAALAGLVLLYVTLRPLPNTAPSVATREAQTLQPPAPAPAPANAVKLQPRTSPHPAPRALPKPMPPLVAKIEPPKLSVGPPRPLRPPVPPTIGGHNYIAYGTGSGVGRAPTVGMAAPARSMSMYSSRGNAVPQAAMPQPVTGLSGASAGGTMATAPRPTTVTLGNGAVAQNAAAAPAPSGVTTADALAAPSAAAETVTVQQSESQALTMDSAAATGMLGSEAPASAMAKKRSLAPTSPAASPTALPSKLPATWLISAGPRTLAADSAGALFLSLDAGRHWQPVAAVWPGKVAQLKLAAAPAVFQLITTTGAIWLSPDGLHWQPQ